jgi:hypothetical protein
MREQCSADYKILPVTWYPISAFCELFRAMSSVGSALVMLSEVEAPVAFDSAQGDKDVSCNEFGQQRTRHAERSRSTRRLRFRSG